MCIRDRQCVIHSFGFIRLEAWSVNDVYIIFISTRDTNLYLISEIHSMNHVHLRKGYKIYNTVDSDNETKVGSSIKIKS